MNPKFFFTDKDLAQINAIQSTWGWDIPRLCIWHLKTALLKRVGGAKVANPRYNADIAQEELSFVDLTFVPDMSRRSGRVCPLAHRDPIMKMIQSHFSQHPLITGSGSCNAHRSEICALLTDDSFHRSFQ